MRSFENTVDRQSIDANAKLTRLLQYCTGKARKVIQCCSVIEPELGYIKAKSLLKERFGNDYVIVESWIEKISGGANLKGTDRVGIQDFSDDLQNYFETLSAMDKISEISNQRSLVQIVQSYLFTYRIDGERRRMSYLRILAELASKILLILCKKQLKRLMIQFLLKLQMDRRIDTRQHIKVNFLDQRRRIYVTLTHSKIRIIIRCNR